MAARKRVKVKQGTIGLDAIREVVRQEVRAALLEFRPLFARSVTTSLDARGMILTAPPRPKLPETPWRPAWAEL